ncbi:hypothetical protein GcM1_018002, partial [Golovinomyces cichoracearum]
NEAPNSEKEKTRKEKKSSKLSGRELKENSEQNKTQDKEADVITSEKLEETPPPPEAFNVIEKDKTAHLLIEPVTTQEILQQNNSVPDQLNPNLADTIDENDIETE